MLRSLAAIVFALLGACTPMAEFSFDGLHGRLEQACSAKEFSGTVMVLVRGREVYSHTRGVASEETAAPITRQTRFRVFSTSKLLTSLAVLRLVEAGKVDLDESIARYLPDAPAGWQLVTVRHLLQHTSGLPDLTEQLLAQWRGNHAAAMSAVLAQATDIVPATSPGDAWQYNNFGYELAAEIAERVTGRPFDQALDRLVFEPAGMKDAIVEQGRMDVAGPVSVPDPRLAVGYNGSATEPEVAAPLSFVQRGARAVHATVGDFVALDQALRGNRLISSRMRFEMTRTLRRPGDDLARLGDRGYGLGVMLRGSNGLLYLGHDGGNNGYVCDFEQFPAKDAVLIVLTNLGFASIDWMPSAVGQALASANAPEPGAK